MTETTDALWDAEMCRLQRRNFYRTAGWWRDLVAALGITGFLMWAALS